MRIFTRSALRVAAHLASSLGVLAVLGVLSPAVGLAQTPAAVFSHANLVTVITATAPTGPSTGTSGGATGHVAANKRGDMFYINGSFPYPTPSQLIEVPANGGPYVQILRNVGNGVRGLTVDAQQNLYLTDNINKNIYFVPFINNGYPSNIDIATLSKCVLPVSKNLTSCKNPFTLPALINYYLIAQDIATDAQGYAYIVDINDGVSGGAYYRILRASSTTGVLTIFVDQLPKATLPEIAADPAGNVYYVDGTNAYYFAAGSTYTLTSGTPTTFGTGLSKPGGVGLDASGNLYIADTGNSRLLEIPVVGGVRANANQYVLSNQVGTTGLGIDGFGNIYYGGVSGANVQHLGVGSLNLGAVAVGSTTAAQNLDLYFTAPATFGSLSFAGGAGTMPYAASSTTCVAGKFYAIGTSCSLSVTFKATLPGAQPGTVRALDNNGAQLAEAALTGYGQAPLLDIDPGISAAVGSGWKSPKAIATDAAGNVYVADSGANAILKNGTTVVSNLNAPTAVAVDGVGSLYIADTGNRRILKAPYANGAYGATLVLYTGVSGPSGLALDPVNNLYVADSGNARVLLLSSSGNQQDGTLVTTVGTGFVIPVAAATDALGNLYISDSGAGQVVQINVPTGVQTSVVTGLTTPAGVAVDASGTLYAVDAGKKTMVRVPYTGGTVSPALQTTLAPAVINPSGLAVDVAGNLYVTDTVVAAVSKVTRSASTLAFGLVDISSTPTFSAALSNAGTAALTLGTPYYTATGNASSFTVQPSSTCGNGVSVATGASCSIDETFTPPGIGPQSASLTIGGNGGSAKLNLSGTGFIAVAATVSGPTSTNYGSAAAYTVTAATDGTYTVNITGTALASTSVTVSGGKGTFTLPGVGAGTYTLAVTLTTASIKVTVNKAPLTVTANPATRVYGAANPVLSATVTGAANGDVLTASATTAATTTSPVGTYPIVPSASGSGIANYTVTPVNSVLTITQAASTSAVTGSPSAIYAGAQITLTASVKSTTTGTPTGVVTFLSNNVPIGTSALTNGAATFLTSKSLTSALYTITVTYSGDSNFSASTSPNLTITVNPPDFTVTSNVSTITIKQGQSGSATLTFATVTGSPTFTPDITLSCSGLPFEASCSYTPSVVNLTNGTATAQITINTVAGTAALQHSAPWELPTGGTTLALLLFACGGRRRARRLRSAGIALLLLGAALLPMAGCGAGSKGVITSTPLGVNNVTVTGGSQTAAVQHSVALTVTITN